MTIKTKFDVGSFVYVIYNNKVRCFDIDSIRISVASRYNPDIRYEVVSPHISYTLNIGGDKKDIFQEEEIFATKEELIESL